MKEYFKDPETDKLFRFWICNHPESYHPLDMERFYGFVLNLFSTGKDLDENILANAIKDEKKWNEEYINDFVDTFMTKYWDLKNFWDYYKKN